MTMITPSYLGETIEYSSLHACRSTLEDPTVRDRISNRVDKTVFIRSDARAKYGDVVKLVDEVRSAGVDNVGLLTDRTETNQAPPPPGD